MLFVEIYDAGMKTSAGWLDGWGVRFYIVDSVSVLQTMYENGDYSDSWVLDENHADIDERKDLEWWDQKVAGNGTWYVADAGGGFHLPCADLVTAAIEGNLPLTPVLKDALSACGGRFWAVKSGPWDWL